MPARIIASPTNLGTRGGDDGGARNRRCGLATLHAFTEPNNASAPTRDRREVVGSAGVVLQSSSASTTPTPTPAWIRELQRVRAGRLKAAVTARNAPTVINRLNLRNFWDGRQDLLQRRHAVWRRRREGVGHGHQYCSATWDPVCQIERASLASQAVGPPLNGSRCRRRANVGRPRPQDVVAQPAQLADRVGGR